MQTLTYEQAISELQQIVDRMKNQDNGIDQLSDQANRAADLIRFCKDKLKHTETHVQHLFDDNSAKSSTNRL